MGLRHYLSVLARRRWVVATTLIVAVAASVAVGRLAEDSYVASATIRAVPGSVLAGEAVRGDELDYADRLQNTYAALATSRELRDRVKRRLNLPTRPDVEVELQANSELLHVSVSDTVAARAARAADAAATELIARVRALDLKAANVAEALYEARRVETARQLAASRARLSELRRTGAPARQIAQRRSRIRLDEQAALEQQVAYEESRLAREQRSQSLVLVASAATPTAPAGPSQLTYVILGVLVGLAGGLGLAFLVDALRTRLETASEISDASQLPVIAAIRRTNADVAVLVGEGEAGVSEDYRRLRATVFAPGNGPVPRSVVVTGAQARQGASTVAANLAQALADAGRRTVIVDANWHDPVLHEVFGVGSEPGLASVLGGRSSLDHAIHATSDPRVSVLPSGAPPAGGIDLIGSQRMAEVVQALEESFDAVVIDAPAFATSADGLALSSLADGVVLVAGRGSAHADTIRWAREQLRAARARVLGVVVSRMDSPVVGGPGLAS